MEEKPLFSNKTGAFSLLIVLSIWTIFIFNGVFSLPLMPPDEPKYASAAEEMLKTGDFITPRFNCHVRFDKPPMIYWMIALSYKIFGVSDWAARLPSILAALGVILITYRFSKEMWDGTVAVISSSVFSSILHVWVMSRAVAPEMVLVFFETLSIYLLWKGLNFKSRKHIILAYIPMALGFLTKGPLGVIVPAMVCGLFFLYRDGFRNTVKGLFTPTGILLFCIIGLPWYVAMIKIHGYRYFEEFFLYHNLYRFTGRARQHPFAFYYYIPFFLGSLYIWLPFSAGVFRVIKEGFRERSSELFLFVWMVSVLIFFSVSANKLHNYILIAYPPISILTAISINRRLPSTNLIRSGFVIMAIFELAAIVVSPFIQKEIHPFIPLGGLITLVLTILITINAGSREKLFPLIMIKALSLLLIVNFYMSAFELKVRPGEFYVMLESIYDPDKTPVFFYKKEREDLVFYAHRCISVLKNPDEVRKELDNSEEILLYVRTNDMDSLRGFNIQERIPFDDISGRKGFILEIERNKKSVNE